MNMGFDLPHELRIGFMDAMIFAAFQNAARAVGDRTRTEGKCAPLVC
jgi:hypothetical protein